jgi:hypothetical protein
MLKKKTAVVKRRSVKVLLSKVCSMKHGKLPECMRGISVCTAVITISYDLDQIRFSHVKVFFFKELTQFIIPGPALLTANTVSHICCTVSQNCKLVNKTNKRTPWLLVCKRTKPNERPRQPANLVPTFADRRCCVVRATDSYGR